MTCPQCGGNCWREDFGTGSDFRGPLQCEDCGWYEGYEVDQAMDAEREESGE